MDKSFERVTAENKECKSWVSDKVCSEDFVDSTNCGKPLSYSKIRI